MRRAVLLTGSAFRARLPALATPLRVLAARRPMPPLINAEPVVHARRMVRRERARPLDEDDETREPFDALEVFGHLREICDPEHPHTLEQARLALCVPARSVPLRAV